MQRKRGRFTLNRSICSVMLPAITTSSFCESSVSESNRMIAPQLVNQAQRRRLYTVSRKIFSRTQELKMVCTPPVLSSSTISKNHAVFLFFVFGVIFIFFEAFVSSTLQVYSGKTCSPSGPLFLSTPRLDHRPKSWIAFTLTATLVPPL